MSGAYQLAYDTLRTSAASGLVGAKLTDAVPFLAAKVTVEPMAGRADRGPVR